jgi:hypothetical protein
VLGSGVSSLQQLLEAIPEDLSGDPAARAAAEAAARKAWDEAERVLLQAQGSREDSSSEQHGHIASMLMAWFYAGVHLGHVSAA